MKKSIASIIVAVVVICSLITALYFYFKAKELPKGTVTHVSIEYLDAVDYIRTLDDGNYILFFYDDNASSSYVKDDVIKPTLTELGISSLPNYIEISMNAVQDAAPSRYFNQWGFSEYPAFVYIAIADHNVSVLSILATNTGLNTADVTNTVPISVDSFRLWLTANDLWTGRIQNSE